MDVRLLHVPGDHVAVTIERNDKRLEEGIPGGLIVRHVHDVLGVRDHHGIKAPVLHAFTQSFQPPHIFLVREGHVIALSHAGSITL